VHTLGDLEVGMVLEGVVTNVAAFGAFVDIGVHQDGLVHVSAMSKNFVSDPREVAKPGDVVQVKVLLVDIPRNRISLTMRTDEAAEAGSGDARPHRGPRQGSRPKSSPSHGTVPADSSSAPASGRGAGPRPGASRQAGDRTGQPSANGGADRRSSGRPGGPAGDRQGGQSRGGQSRGGQPGGGSGTQRGGASDRGPDSRTAGSDSSTDRRGNGSGTSNDRRGNGSPQGGDRRGTPPAPANGAMAEALRRAGLLNDAGTPTKGKPATPSPRRNDRP
jgi:uncharacterized protein